MGRTFHSDDRTYGNFQDTELAKLCGVSKGRWPLYVLKELLDNAVAAMEENADPVRMVRIDMGDGRLRVSDSGSGIPESALESILDFTRFGGSNRHHRLPTRGAQGNAVMTIFGISAIWETYVEVGRRGCEATRMKVVLNPVKQSVEVVAETIPTACRMSYVEVGMPPLPWVRGGTTTDDMEVMARRFAVLNPHVTFSFYGASMWSMPSSSRDSAMPRWPSAGAASWFTDTEFADRLAADLRARPDTQIAQWLQEFMGRQRTTDTRTLASVVPSSNDRALRALASTWRADCVKNGSSCDDPKFNGVGQDRMRDLLLQMGCDADTPCEYMAVKGTFDRGGAKVPYLLEVALLQMPEKTRSAPPPVIAMNRTVLYASPKFDSLLWREKVRGPHHSVSGDLGALAQAYQIQSGKFCAGLAVHVTCPSPGYEGFGKQQFDTSWLQEPLSECAEKVTLPLRKQREGESRRGKTTRPKSDTIRRRLFDIFPGAYERACSYAGSRLVKPLIRQLYYEVRPVWYEDDDRELNYQTFCVYFGEYEVEVGESLCLRDARGTLYEPHSGKVVRLGTAAVDAFEPKRWEGHTIIFVEKENLAEWLRAHNVGKRWDAIIVGSKGFAVEAIRDVLQKYKRLLGSTVKIICLHDADPAGYLIGHDLANNLPRFGDNVDVQVLDVGLTIREARQMGLQDEPFTLIPDGASSGRFQEWTKVANMRRLTKRTRIGISPLLDAEAWDAFMPAMVRTGDPSTKPSWVTGKVDGRRIELNALGAKKLVPWLETHLEANGCKKVRPPDDIIDEKMRVRRANEAQNRLGSVFLRMMGEDAVMEVIRRMGPMAHDLDRILEGRPEQHWEYLADQAATRGLDVDAIAEQVLKERLPSLFGGTSG